MDKLNQIEQKLDACVAGTGSLGVYDGNNVFLGYLVGAPASSIQVFDPVNDLRHSRRLVVCEPLKAVVNLGPPQRWQLFP